MQLASYVATIVGIPIAIFSFIYQERKARRVEQQAIYDELLEHYTQIQDRLLRYPELDVHDRSLESSEDRRRQRILYAMLISLFERAFIMLHDEKEAAYKRMWNSWLDNISEWASKPNFRELLPELMIGEDPEFTRFMEKTTGLSLKEAEKIWKAQAIALGLALSWASYDEEKRHDDDCI